MPGPLGLVGLYIRLRLDDTPEFKGTRRDRQRREIAAAGSDPTSWASILRVIGLFVIFNIGYYVVFTYLPTYFIKTLHFTKTQAFPVQHHRLPGRHHPDPPTGIAERPDRPAPAVDQRRRRLLRCSGYPPFLLLNSAPWLPRSAPTSDWLSSTPVHPAAVSAGGDVRHPGAPQRIRGRLQRVRRTSRRNHPVRGHLAGGAHRQCAVTGVLCRWRSGCFAADRAHGCVTAGRPLVRCDGDRAQSTR